MTPREALRLVGRRIVSVELNATWEGEGPQRVRMTDPRIFLDDGTYLRFLPEEHPSGDVGSVAIVHERAGRASLCRHDLSHLGSEGEAVWCADCGGERRVRYREREDDL